MSIGTAARGARNHHDSLVQGKATPQNADKIRKPSHGDVMLQVTVHLPNVKIGCQKLRGQKKTEMKYCTQLWSDVRLLGVDGIWGGAVLWKTPIRM
jgi:hypothetical protein